MRRFLKVVPAFLVLGCLAGCGDDDAATTTAAPAATAAPTTTTTTMAPTTTATSTTTTTTRAPTTTTAPTTSTTTTTAPTTTTTTPSGGVTLVIEMEDTADWKEMDDAVDSGEGTFRATGPAVEDGLMCPSGTVVWTLQSETETEQYTLVYLEESILAATCDDGDGGFTLWEEVLSEWGDDPVDSEGSWTMGEGSGALAGWVGEGGMEGTFYPIGSTWNCERTYTGILSKEG